MRRIRVWGLSAALAAGAVGPAAAADPPAEKMTLMKKLFGPSTPKPAARPGPVVPQRPVTVSAPLPPDVLAASLQAEQDAYLRRVSVCTELRRVAVELSDEALVREADDLERKAASLYNARVASLGVSRVRAPLPEPSTTNLVSLEGPTSPAVAANRLTAPAAPVPGATAQAPTPTGGPIREVKP